MTDEEFYDDEVAPVLLGLAEKFQDRGLGFLALAQWSPEEVARTVTLPANSLGVLRYADALARCATPGGVNIDSFLLAVMKEARVNGHSSMMLRSLGVPVRPEASEKDRPDAS